MSEIRNWSDYSSQYSKPELDSLFSTSTSGNSSNSGAIDLANYASIKNGSYKKVLNAYYKNQKAEAAASGQEDPSRLTTMKASADTLKKAADALRDGKLWEKKKITTKDKETGEETTTEDYDYDAIKKAIGAFVDAYNDVVDKAGDSNVTGVLQNGAWMTSQARKMGGILASAGVSIGADNKLSFDADKIKDVPMHTLKNVFGADNSFSENVATKATGMSNAVTRSNQSYTKTGGYSDVLSDLMSRKIDTDL
ncbi:MAG: hypothetical protein K5985_04110 [Lachnospiraceae bacterium]|nr:hypothetical protein [Lachnospiraceae bacterium]